MIEMIEAIFTVIAFFGIYAGIWLLFNKKDGGGVG